MADGATRDLSALKKSRARGLALLSAERFDVGAAVASSDQVAMEVTWTGTICAAAGPFAAGQTLRAQLAIFLTFRDGQIMRRHNYDCYDPW